MNLKLLFFASLREQFGFSQKEIALSRTVKSPEEFLLIMSKESGGEWINLFNNKKLYKVAINKDLASWRNLIVEGDELAIFPPITGG